MAIAVAVCAAWAAAPAHAATNNIFTVAGSTPGLSGDGGPATAAQLAYPIDVALTGDGGFLIADQDNNLVRRVSPTGTITTVAGIGTRGLSGDGGPATAAELAAPTGVAVTPDGGFLIADRGNDRVRRVSPAGTITTVAGTTSGMSGDGGPATAAQLSAPTGVAVTAGGGFLIADENNARVRRVSPTGVITTVAGTTSGLSGDGGPATAAQLAHPTGIAETSDGGFLIADQNNHRVRRVSPTGTITTVAGTTWGLSGDGGPATAAGLYAPTGIAVTPDGGFLFADWGNHRIKFVDADLRGPSSGPQGPQGPAGTTGAQGPRGASTVQNPPRPPAASPVRLAFALATARLHARPRQRLTLPYAATTSATVDLALLRGRRRIAHITAKARAGRNLIRLRAPARAGRYRLQVLVATADGQRAVDRARLTVSRR